MTNWRPWPGQYVQRAAGENWDLVVFCVSLKHPMLLSRAVRQQNKPFGGIQLIICGDFLQLPPVTKGFQPPRFCFQVLLTS